MALEKYQNIDTWSSGNYLCKSIFVLEFQNKAKVMLVMLFLMTLSIQLQLQCFT